MISIVIPVYNAEDTIGKLLDSIIKSGGFEICEILVVDDKSTDSTCEIVSKYPAKLIRNTINSGSAQTRNTGATAAQGETIIFFDSDVVIQNDTIMQLIEGYQQLPPGNALIGIYSKNSLRKGYIAEFKALIDYHHWLIVKNKTVTAFEPRCAIIGKDTFKELGGFNENIKGADVEDYEFGYRLLNQNGKIYLNKSIQVDHHFPIKFSTLAKNFLQRGTSWMQLLLIRKQFDNVGTTKKSVLVYLFAFLTVLLLILNLFVTKLYVYTTLSSFILYLYCDRSFLYLNLREKGIFFTIKSILLQHVLSCIIVLAGIKGSCRFLKNVEK